MLLGRICKFVYLIADCITSFDLNGMYCSKTARPYDLISCADLNLVPVDNADYYYDEGLSPEGSTYTSFQLDHVVDLLDVTRDEFVSKSIPKPDVDIDALEELCSNITIKLDERIGTGSLYLIRR